MNEFEKPQKIPRPRKGKYRFFDRSKNLIFADLWLYPEFPWTGGLIDCDDNEMGRMESFLYVIGKNEMDNSQEWIDDCVPISWFVCGEIENKPSIEIFEGAPFDIESEESKYGSNFLDFFSWPFDSNDQALNWFNLPVKFSRYPKLENDFLEIGWKPSPGQKNAPLRRIWEMMYEVMNEEFKERKPFEDYEINIEALLYYKSELLEKLIERHKKLVQSNKQLTATNEPPVIEIEKFQYGKISNGDSGIHWKSVGEVFHWICHICGNETERKGGTHLIKRGCTVDHIVPQSKGGANTWNNVRPAHWECNIRKNNHL